MGDGSSIDIWEDPWIPSLPRFRLLTPNGDPERPKWVREFITQNAWDTRELSKWVTENECKAIVQIPIPLNRSEDKWAWHFTKNGEFSVRSAYYLELEENKKARASSSTDPRKTIWEKLWAAQVPTKIKQFGWRALHQGIAVGEALRKRGCIVENVCPMCGELNEIVNHALLTCPEVNNIWKSSPLRLEVGSLEVHSFMDWVIRTRMKVTNPDWWNLFWSLLWGVWLRRNAWVFEKRRMESMEVILKAGAVVEEYSRANEASDPIIEAEKAGGNIWQAPDEGSYKINTDAAIFESGKVGLGGVIRDHVGEVVAATCMVENGSVEVEVAEALAA